MSTVGAVEAAWRINLAAMSRQCPVCNKKQEIATSQPIMLGMQTYVETLRNQI